MPGQEKPIGIAIIVCEKVIQDASTGNKTLVSIFNSITALAFPCRHDSLSVYVALTSGMGKKRVSLKMRQLEKTIFTAEGNIEFENPNQVVELIFNLRSFIFAQPGLYSFDIYADDEYVFESRFNVIHGTGI